VGGITLDPALMMVSVDDHMVHRGHGVFDTCLLANGQLYMLDAHVERLLRSAKQAGVRDFYKPSTIKNIVHDVAAASGLVDGETPLSASFLPSLSLVHCPFHRHLSGLSAL
jgi:4-amino-4-deoxychorismate lyase